MKTRLMTDLKQAMRDKDTVKKGVLQLLKARVDAFLKDNNLETINGKDFFDIVNAEIKQLDHTLYFAKDAGRQDLVDEIAVKKDILYAYLPKQLTYDEVSDQVMKKIDTSLPLGQNMKLFMEHFRGYADNKTISTVVRSHYAK